MPKNLAYSPARICLWLGWLLDQALRLPCPQLCAPSHIPIGPFERKASMCLHNAAITSMILTQINQMQYNSQIQRIPKIEVRLSNSLDRCWERERHIYTKAHFNCANLKMSLVVMDWMRFGKNCYFLPHYHPLPLHQCWHKMRLSRWPYPNFSLNTQTSDFTAQALRMGVLLLCCALKGLSPCYRTPFPRRGPFCG